MVRFVADERAEPWLRSRLPWENGITTKYWDRSKTIWGRWGLRDSVCGAARRHAQAPAGTTAPTKATLGRGLGRR